MPARTLACVLLFTACALAGCGTAVAPRASLTPAMEDPTVRLVRADQPPVRLLDCDRDGLISHAELDAGFRLHQRTVSAAEFDAGDLSRDGKWNETEFARFLNHRTLRAWSVFRACPGPADLKK